MHVVDCKSLEEVTGVQHDVRRVSDLGYAVIEHGYEQRLLAHVLDKAISLKQKAQQTFLDLRHLRRAHR